MSDLPQLEHALVDAARRRVRRRPAAPRWVRPTLVAAAAIALVVLAVRGLGPDAEHAASPPPAPSGGALAVQAIEETEADPSCRLLSGRGRLVDDAPSAKTLAAFGVFRRAPHDGDEYRPRWVRQPLAGAEILAGSTRRVRAADGALFHVGISRGPYVARLRDAERCGELRRAAFDRLAAGRPSAVIERGRVLLERSLLDDGGAGPGQEHLELRVLHPDGAMSDAAAMAPAEVRESGL